MSEARWPDGLAIIEGVANGRSGRWISLIVVVTVAWVTACVGLANALEVNALARAEDAWIRAGAFVMSVEPGSSEGGNSIDVAACEQLNQVAGVEASFASTLTGATNRPRNAPGMRTTLTQVSPGIYPFLGVDEPRGVGMVASVAAMELAGITNGEETIFRRIQMSGDSTDFQATAVIVNGVGLGPALQGSFMMPTLLVGEADSCHVRTDAAHVAAATLYVSQALSAPNGSLAVVRPLVPQDPYGIDFTTVYSWRILRWAWLGGALMITALWGLVQRARRTRHAIYQTFGVHTRARLVMEFTEWAVLSLPGIAWGWGIATTLAIGLGADPGTSLAQITLQIIAVWCAASLAVIGIGLIPVGTLLDALKDRS